MWKPILSHIARPQVHRTRRAAGTRYEISAASIECSYCRHTSFGWTELAVDGGAAFLLVLALALNR
jgi:hypothetical protein